METGTGGAANKGLPNCRRGELDRCYIPVAGGVFTERKGLDHCATEEYRKWWEGTHLRYETLKRYPDDIGNVVFMDEYIGSTV